jgi:hypothetical protein
MPAFLSPRGGFVLSPVYPMLAPGIFFGQVGPELRVIECGKKSAPQTSDVLVT